MERVCWRVRPEGVPWRVSLQRVPQTLAPGGGFLGVFRRVVRWSGSDYGGPLAGSPEGQE